jgi:hypothetical protein
MPQITYPMPINTNPQVKTEINPPPPSPPQIQEPPQQLTLSPHTAQSSQLPEVPNPRQCHNYYRQVNHVVVEGPITQTKWSHMPITFSSQDVKLASFPHMPWSSPSTSIDGTSPKSSSIMVAKLKSFSPQPSTKCVSIESSSKNQ